MCSARELGSCDGEQPPAVAPRGRGVELRELDGVRAPLLVLENLEDEEIASMWMRRERGLYAGSNPSQSPSGGGGGGRWATMPGHTAAEPQLQQI